MTQTQPAEPTSGARGRFITLEGGEGVGKSTNLAFVVDALEARGIEVVMNRCPKIELFRPFWKPKLNLGI